MTTVLLQSRNIRSLAAISFVMGLGACSAPGDVGAESTAATESALVRCPASQERHCTVEPGTHIVDCECVDKPPPPPPPPPRNPPEVFTWTSGEMFAMSVEGFVQVSIMSDGYWKMNGRAHESGAWGENYLLYVVPNAKDSQGRAITFAHDGYVAGTFVFGSSDDFFEVAGWDAQIRDNFYALRDNGATLHLHAATNGWALVESTFVGLGIGAWDGAIYILGGGGNAPPTKCQNYICAGGGGPY